MKRLLTLIMIILIQQCLIVMPYKVTFAADSSTQIGVCLTAAACNNPTPQNSPPITLSAYVRQVLANEWPSDANLESLKAGVIAIRTFTNRGSPCGAFVNLVNGTPPVYSVVNNIAQKYDRSPNPQISVTQSHIDAQTQTDALLLYRTDNTFACAKYKTDVGNPTLACVAGACTGDTTDQNTLSSVPDPVAVANGSIGEGMGQNGSKAWAWSQNNAKPWEYRQILTHYYKQVKISSSDNNLYRWVWLDRSNSIAFTSPTTGKQYYAPIANTPLSMASGKIYDVPMQIQNVGNDTWGYSGANPTKFSYHWYTTSGSLVVWDGIRTGIGLNTGPASTYNFTAKVYPPEQAGTYILKWDMVKEGITWFSQQQNWPTQNITVQVYPALHQELWRRTTQGANQGWQRAVLIVNGNVDWNTASAWTGPLSMVGLSGSGDMQAKNTYRVSSILREGYYRGNQGWARDIPIVNGYIDWANAPVWTGPNPISNLPGSGDMQSLGNHVIGPTLRQGFWRGNQGWGRDVPIVNGVIQWGSATAWSGPNPLSNLPGSGDMQAQTSYVLGTTYWQTFWRSNVQYTRSVPIVNGVIQWGSATGWIVSTPGNLPGSGEILAQSDYIFP